MTLSKASKEQVLNYFTEFNPERKALKVKWWKEIVLIGLFYVIYSYIRNQFGSNSTSPETALNNAMRLIDIENFIGLYREPQIQNWFIDYEFFLRFWNIFYGLCHFAVTILVFVWLYIRFPWDFIKKRTVGLTTTGLGLIGFATFPVMPPRLLGASIEDFGAGLADSEYVDTIKEFGGLWSFDSGTVAEISNQYAAMPSIHVAWALWCGYIIFDRVNNRIAKTVAVLYPLATLFAIVVTANHYWLDAVGGALVLIIAYFSVSWIFNKMNISGKINLRLQSTRNLQNMTTANAGTASLVSVADMADMNDSNMEKNMDNNTTASKSKKI